MSRTAETKYMHARSQSVEVSNFNDAPERLRSFSQPTSLDIMDFGIAGVLVPGVNGSMIDAFDPSSSLFSSDEDNDDISQSSDAVDIEQALDENFRLVNLVNLQRELILELQEDLEDERSHNEVLLEDRKHFGEQSDDDFASVQRSRIAILETSKHDMETTNRMLALEVDHLRQALEAREFELEEREGKGRKKPWDMRSRRFSTQFISDMVSEMASVVDDEMPKDQQIHNLLMEVEEFKCVLEEKDRQLERLTMELQFRKRGLEEIERETILSRQADQARLVIEEKKRIMDAKEKHDLLNEANRLYMEVEQKSEVLKQVEEKLAAQKEAAKVAQMESERMRKKLSDLGVAKRIQDKTFFNLYNDLDLVDVTSSVGVLPTDDNILHLQGDSVSISDSGSYYEENYGSDEYDEEWYDDEREAYGNVADLYQVEQVLEVWSMYIEHVPGELPPFNMVKCNRVDIEPVVFASVKPAENKTSLDFELGCAERVTSLDLYPKPDEAKEVLMKLTLVENVVSEEIQPVRVVHPVGRFTSEPTKTEDDSLNIFRVPVYDSRVTTTSIAPRNLDLSFCVETSVGSISILPENAGKDVALEVTQLNLGEVSTASMASSPRGLQTIQPPKSNKIKSRTIRNREEQLLPVGYVNEVFDSESAPSESETTKEYIRRLTKIYRKKREATRLENVLKLLKVKYANNPHELYLKVCDKYNIKSEPKYIAPGRKSFSPTKIQELDVGLSTSNHEGDSLTVDGNNAVVREYIERITKIYKLKREMTKLEKAIKLMQTQYARNPHELYIKICKKYGVKIEPEFKVDPKNLEPEREKSKQQAAKVERMTHVLEPKLKRSVEETKGDEVGDDEKTVSSIGNAKVDSKGKLQTQKDPNSKTVEPKETLNFKGLDHQTGTVFKVELGELRDSLYNIRDVENENFETMDKSTEKLKNNLNQDEKPVEIAGSKTDNNQESLNSEQSLNQPNKIQPEHENDVHYAPLEHERKVKRTIISKETASPSSPKVVEDFFGPNRHERVKKVQRKPKAQKNLEGVVTARKSLDERTIEFHTGPIQHKRIRKKKLRRAKRKKNYEDIVIPRKSVDCLELTESVEPIKRRKKPKNWTRGIMLTGAMSPHLSQLGSPKAVLSQLGSPKSVISKLGSPKAVSTRNEEETRSTTGTVETSASKRRRKKKRRKKREMAPTLLTVGSFRSKGEEQELLKPGGQKDRKKSRKLGNRSTRSTRSIRSGRSSKRSSKRNGAALSSADDFKSNTTPAKAMIKYEKSTRKKKLDETARKRDPLRFQAIRHKVKPENEGEVSSKVTGEKANKEVPTENDKEDLLPSPNVQEPVRRTRKRRRRSRKRENFGGTVSNDDHMADSQKYFHMTTITIKMNLVELYGKKEVMDENPHELWKNCKALQIPMNKYNLYIEDTLRSKHGLPELAFRLKDYLNAPYKKRLNYLRNRPSFTFAS